MEAGEITFSATQNEDGTISFGINSTSKVDNGAATSTNGLLGLEDHARSEQATSWNEVLTNIVNYLQGTEQDRTTSVKEDE